MPKKILFLVPYPLKESPSQRFRFEQYFALLTENGFEFDIQSFLDQHNWQLFYSHGKPITKVLVLLKGFLKRIATLSRVPKYDFVFIHREVTPIGPPIFEWLISQLFKKKIIYDFDDAIWLTDRTTEPWIVRLIKWRKKVNSICRWSYKISCGNQYLASFASKHNRNTVINPTTIDTNSFHNPSLYDKVDKENQVVIGWTGSHSTLKYLSESFEILSEIQNRFPKVKLVVIADRKPEFELRNLSFIAWNSESEIQDLMTFDVGIMPLPDDEWAKGKCGFKILQYMALGIPAIASPVGVNRQIIEQGKDGFLCATNEDWLQALSKLIEDPLLRVRMGENGRQKVIYNYSVESNSSLFLRLFE